MLIAKTFRRRRRSSTYLLKICHFVHSTAIGGVETAAATLQASQSEGVTYRVAALAGIGHTHHVSAIPAPDFVGNGINSPLSALKLALWARRSRGDVIVASLWRSVVAGVLAKFLRPSASLVVFLHNTRYTNLFDRFAHYIGLALADAVFCDSEATRHAMLRGPYARKPVCIVPLIVRKSLSVSDVVDARSDASIDLVYWGRIARQKRVDRAVRLVAELRRIGPVPVTFTIFGPDDGDQESVMSLARTLGVSESIRWRGPALWPRIAEAAAHSSFFVQLSDFEGLSMSAVEAMQVGLVPVVTPVGQIDRFTEDGGNAVYYSDPATTARRLLNIWRDPEAYRELSRAALRQWSDNSEVGAEFNAACRAVKARSLR